MARPAKRSEIEDITDLAEEIVAIIDELIGRYQAAGDVRSELEALKIHATVLAQKPEKIAKLRDFRGYKFALFDEEGNLRTATRDESLRLIMGYQRGNVLNIYQQWTVVDGQWVQRPATNPDGSPRIRTED